MAKMNAMIRCDDVFMVLTRGPFPTGQPSDAAVEAHLHVCAACRRLAEALRPAEELVPETVAPEESRSLPSYWGPTPVIEPRVRSAVLAEFDYGPNRRRRRAKRLQPRRPAASWGRLVAFLGAVCIGLALAMLYYGAAAIFLGHARL